MASSLSRPPKLGLEFYARPADTVANDLLGMTLIINHDGFEQRGRIVETEAYLGEQDLAAHSSKGRTPRTEVMFGPPAVSYVYLIYGMYNMFNIVTDKEDSAHAVLVRAIEPLLNIEGKTDGPGKLCKAMGITREHNKLSLLGEKIWLEQGAPAQSIKVTPRIGIDYAKEWKDAPLRFLDADSKFVSKPR